MPRSYTATLLFLLMITQAAFAQKTWKVKDAGLSYELPESWRSDPFSTSSVCDCRGTINDNGEWDAEYIGMVVYPVNEMIKLDAAKRQFVWDQEYTPNSKISELEFNGIRYQMTEGSFNNTKGENKAWRFTTINNDRGKYKHYVIYFWTTPEVFDAHQETFERIMESVERKRVKKSKRKKR